MKPFDPNWREQNDLPELDEIKNAFDTCGSCQRAFKLYEMKSFGLIHFCTDCYRLLDREMP